MQSPEVVMYVVLNLRVAYWIFILRDKKYQLSWELTTFNEKRKETEWT